MVVVTWLAQNWQAVTSLAGLLLAVGVSVAHLAHKEDVAQELQTVKDGLAKLQPPQA